MKMNVANIISLTRPFLALSLFFFINNVRMFIIMYTLCWFTDLIDGPIARATKTKSDFGSKLDDLGDYTTIFVLVVIMTIWLGARMNEFIPLIITIFLIKIGNGIITKAKYGKVYIIHTYLAKFTAFVIFIAPIVFLLTGSIALFYVVMIVGYLEAVEECIIHFTRKTYNPEKKSIFLKTIDERVIKEEG